MGCVVFCFTVIILVCGTSASLTAQAQQAGDWITVNKDYSSQRYVDLDQITPELTNAALSPALSVECP